MLRSKTTLPGNNKHPELAAQFNVVHTWMSDRDLTNSNSKEVVQKQQTPETTSDDMTSQAVIFFCQNSEWRLQDTENLPQ